MDSDSEQVRPPQPRNILEAAQRCIDPQYTCTLLESANRNEFQFASPYSKEYRFDALLRMLVRFLKTSNFGRFEDSLLLMLVRFVQEHAVQRTFRRDDLEVMWDVFLHIYLWVNKFDPPGQQCIVNFYNIVYRQFDVQTQPIFIKRLCFEITKSKASLPYEPQWTAVLIDSFAHNIQLSSFSAELGSIWGIFADHRYDDPFAACAYYSSLFLTAKRQALLRIKLPMLQVVRRTILEKMTTQIADFVQLKEREEKVDEKSENPQELDLSTPETVHLKALLQCTIQDALRCIDEVK